MSFQGPFFEPAPGAVVAGKFRSDRLIARGGMGSIWAGWDLDLERPVAIKFMDAVVSASPEQRARFDREAKAAARLRTPHVVQIFAHGVEGGRPYIVMELLEGEDLGARLKRERRISGAAAVHVASQMTKALRRAHDEGIVHRDLKPQNVFLARSDDDEVVKILDFGIAKRQDAHAGDDSTRTGEILGSPHYMSPEQARGLRDIDVRTDLWSFAVILFRALSGELPFKGEAIGDTIYKICSAPLPSVRDTAPDLPISLDAFFARGLAREPAERFQSAVELLSAFQAAVGVDGDVSARMRSQTAPVPSRGAPYPVGSDTPPLTPASLSGQAPFAVAGGSGTFSRANGTASIPAGKPVSGRVLVTAALAAFALVGGGLALALILARGTESAPATAAAPESTGAPAAAAAAPAAAEPTSRPEPANTNATPPATPTLEPSATAPAASAAPAPTASAKAVTAPASPPAKPTATPRPTTPPPGATRKPGGDWGY